jgi:hypothetical protein
VDLDEVANELYGISPEEFMARRTARIAEARAAGDRALAKSIGQLRKPTRSAWLVNLVAREAADDLVGLLEIGAALRQAQAELSGPDLRRLSQQRHRAIEALARRAAAIGAAQGYSATETGRQEVSQTLQAALADESAAEVVRAGRVTQSLTYGGFGPLDLTAGPPASGSAPAEVAPSGDEQRKGPSAAELQAARAAAEAALGDLASADAEAAAAASRVEQVSAELTELRGRLADLECGEVAARTAALAAREQLSAARETADRAKEALDALSAR